MNYLIPLKKRFIPGRERDPYAKFLYFIKRVEEVKDSYSATFPGWVEALEFVEDIKGIHRDLIKLKEIEYQIDYIRVFFVNGSIITIRLCHVVLAYEKRYPFPNIFDSEILRAFYARKRRINNELD